MTISRHEPRRHRGAVISSSIPYTPDYERTRGTSGLMFDAVVLSTYVWDDTADGTTSHAPEAMIHGPLCDVLVFSTVPGIPNTVLPRVPVRQDRGYMHEGEIWIPRPCTKRFDGNDYSGDMTTLRNANPADLDGEMVLVGFRDNNPNRPIIMGGVAHGRRDQGNDDAPIGTRLIPKKSDGFPRLTKHQGVVWGVDGSGNYLLDARRAHLGKTTADGSEATEVTSGAAGNIRLYVKPGSIFEIVGPNGDIWRIETDGTAKISAPKVELGADATHPVIQGDDYNEAHKSVDDQMHTLMQSLGAAATAFLTTLATPGRTPATPVTTAEMTTFITSAFNPVALQALAAALLTFKEVDAPAALSQDVKTR